METTCVATFFAFEPLFKTSEKRSMSVLCHPSQYTNMCTPLNMDEEDLSNAHDVKVLIKMFDLKMRKLLFQYSLCEVKQG
jgi:hypothetical protein